jgi:hypothetical protein
MGVRVTFWEMPEDDLKKAIIKDFEMFKVWYLSIAKEYPDEVSYDLVEFIEGTTNSNKLFEEIDHKLIDELVGVYLGYFCDYVPGKINTVRDSACINISNYERDFKLIEARCDRRVAELWNHILKGKSLGESGAVEIIDDDIFRYSVFSEEECQFLLQELSRNFDVTTPNNFDKMPAIRSVIGAIENKKSIGMLTTVA